MYDFGIAFDIEDRLLELGADGVDGFEGVVLEDFLADFIPEIFLGVELWRIGRQEEQRDIVGKREVAAAMIGGAIENQENILPGKLSREDIEERLEAGRVRCRHDQIDAGSVLRGDRAVQIDVFADELGGDLGPHPDRRPARPWTVDPAEAGFIGEHDAQATAAPGGSPLGFPHSIWKAAFLKAF